MKYVCVENDKVVSVLNYAPNVPKQVQVFPITDQEADLMWARTHHFNVITQLVEPVGTMQAQRITQQSLNTQALKYLHDTDWQVLRHIRQLHLGDATSLTAEEYTQLERERARRAAQIKS